MAAHESKHDGSILGTRGNYLMQVYVIHTELKYSVTTLFILAHVCMIASWRLDWTNETLASITFKVSHASRLTVNLLITFRYCGPVC